MYAGTLVHISTEKYIAVPDEFTVEHSTAVIAVKYSSILSFQMQGVKRLVNILLSLVL